MPVVVLEASWQIIPRLPLRSPRALRELLLFSPGGVIIEEVLTRSPQRTQRLEPRALRETPW